MTLLFIAFYFNLIFSEVIFKFSSGQSGWCMLTTPFLVVFAIVFALICNLFNKKGSRVCQFVLFAALFFYYGIELVYQHIFKSFLSISQIGMGADAISTYKQETFFGIMEKTKRKYTYKTGLFSNKRY